MSAPLQLLCGSQVAAQGVSAAAGQAVASAIPKSFGSNACSIFQGEKLLLLSPFSLTRSMLVSGHAHKASLPTAKPVDMSDRESCCDVFATQAALPQGLIQDSAASFDPDLPSF